MTLRGFPLSTSSGSMTREVMIFPETEVWSHIGGLRDLTQNTPGVSEENTGTGLRSLNSSNPSTTLGKRDSVVRDSNKTPSHRGTLPGTFFPASTNICKFF